MTANQISDGVRGSCVGNVHQPLRFAFPYRYDIVAQSPQISCLGLVAAAVVRDLTEPNQGVPFRNRSSRTSAVTVPETSMHEYGP